MVQSTYLCVILLVQPTINSRGFYLIPYSYSQASSNATTTEGKIVSKYWIISKTKGVVHQLPLPAPPCTTVGVCFACASEG